MRIGLAGLSLLIAAPAASQPCPSEGWDRPRLEALRNSSFVLEDPAARNSLASALVACLASPEPRLRDAIAYEGLATMLRGDGLAPDSRTALARDLLGRLSNRDAGGFEAPFAALVLSEVVRADTRAPFLPVDLRDAIADSAARYLADQRDYRGFDEREGWRHGVAHGADLLAQVASNPAVSDRARLERIRDAIAAQAAPTGHFYVYGEPERLMLPLIILARRSIFSASDWSAWFEQLAAPAPFAAWGEVFASQAGLAKRHNMRAFLYAVWLNARVGNNEADDVLLAGSEAALRAIP